MPNSGPERLTIRPMTNVIGARVDGVDLSAPLAAEDVATIRRALLEWKVIFFADQSIGPAEQVRFGESFGTVSPGHPSLPGLDGHPEILPLTNEMATDANGEAVIESEWHTDVTFTVKPPLGSILRAVTVPERGGDTHWSNLVVAYEALSAPIRHLVDGLHAVHRNTLHVARMGEGLSSDLRSRFSGRPSAAYHPVVRVHPETKERALFVNPTFTSHIVELTRTESNSLLTMLYDHLQHPEFTVRFRWEPGSIAFWDNRTTAHLAPRDLAAPPGAASASVAIEREMHRITLDGDVPAGIDGSRSRELDGAAFL